jgi:hypothetical protein
MVSKSTTGPDFLTVNIDRRKLKVFKCDIRPMLGEYDTDRYSKDKRGDRDDDATKHRYGCKLYFKIRSVSDSMFCEPTTWSDRT